MNSPLISGKAYQLYRREFDTYLQRARGVLRSSELTPELLDEMRRNFHRLRGSSGFFGLKDVEVMAQELEAVFSLELERATDEIERVRTVIEELGRAFHDLEVPGSPPRED